MGLRQFTQPSLTCLGFLTNKQKEKNSLWSTNYLKQADKASLLFH